MTRFPSESGIRSSLPTLAGTSVPAFFSATDPERDPFGRRARAMRGAPALLRRPERRPAGIGRPARIGRSPVCSTNRLPPPASPPRSACRPKPSAGAISRTAASTAATGWREISTAPAGGRSSSASAVPASPASGPTPRPASTAISSTSSATAPAQRRRLERHRSGAPPVAAMPRDRRHPRRALSAGARTLAMPLRGAALPSRASLSRRLVGAQVSGAGRRRHRQRRRRARRAAHLARSAPARQGGRGCAQEGARADLRSCGAVRGRPRRRPRFARRRRGDRNGALADYGHAGNRHHGGARIVIARDNDPDGALAAERLARRCARTGVAATVIVPVGNDFNDDLISLGAPALRARLAPLARFGGRRGERGDG